MTKKGPKLHKTYEETVQGQVGDKSDYEVLVSSFAVLIEDCSPAIEEAMQDPGSVMGELDRSESPVAYVMSDVLNICGAIAGASGQDSDEVARIFTILMLTSQGRRPLAEELDSQEFRARTFELLRQSQGQGTGCLCIPEIVARYDTAHHTQLITRVIDSYWRLTVAATAPFMTCAVEDADIMSAIAAVAKEYLTFLEKYTIQDEDNCSDSSCDNPSGNDASASASENCSGCAEAYRLLELPFGAGADEVKQAQRELAKNLHPDVWMNRRGSRAAEEQLKQINASCDHLSECRWPAKAASTKEKSKEPSPPPKSQWDDYVGRSRPPASKPEPSFNTDAWNVAHDGGTDSRFWRIVRVVLRAVWRTTKIVLAILLASIAAAIFLLGIFMALSEYWEGQSKAKSGHSSLGSFNGRFFSFLESVTWLPRQIWGGLMLVSTLLFVAIVFAGQAIGEFASSNSTACIVVACLLGLWLMAWGFRKEWQAEFAPLPGQQAPETSSSLLGMLVIVASCIGGLWFATQSRAVDPVGAESGAQSQAQPQQTRQEPIDPMPSADTSSSSAQQPEVSPEPSNDQTGSAESPADSAGEATRVDASDVGQTLAGWAQATNDNNLDREMSFYADPVDRYFLALNVTPEFIRKDKERFYNFGERFISYRIDSVSIGRVSSDEVTVSLIKHWEVRYSGGNTHTDQTNSQLQLRLEQDRWVITAERDLK